MHPMDKRKTPMPPRHRAYPMRPPSPKPATEVRSTAAIADRSGAWTRAVPEGRRFPRA
jgi:hypothetical protein